MPPIVPPGGFAGFSQMTAASRAALSKFGRRTRTSGKRRKRKASARKRTSSSRKRGRKLKFGSPAWRKKYMK